MAEAFPDSPNLSPTSSQASSLTDWGPLEIDITKEEIDNFLKHAIPRSTAYQTNNKINCNICTAAEHKMKRQYRQCFDCPVKYRVDYCSISDNGKIYKSLI